MTQRDDIIINMHTAEESGELTSDHWGAFDRVLTTMPRMEHLGVNLTRVPPGRTACPFHTHQIDDEVFIVLEGTGILRYGDDVFEIGPGDSISCPAGSGKAHQIANTGDVDLKYLAIGYDHPHEVCTYPDSGKVMVRSLRKVGRMTETDYNDGEPDPPRFLELIPE